jgi:hypothetical protein
MKDFGPPEHVYVENEWYDGPRIGLADVQGRVHRFKSLFDEKEDEYLGRFLVWPVDAEELSLEQEQWAIFVSWNKDYERGIAGVETHPGNPGTSARWDELHALLRAKREIEPRSAKIAEADLVFIEKEDRYSLSGPSYMMRWKLL